jgi:hypothetical protein
VIDQHSEEDYQEVLARLIDYARDDWLGMEIITGRVRKCFDHNPSYAEVRPLAVRAVRDLINAGAVAGAIAVQRDNSWRFEPWPVTLEQAIERITRGLQERNSYPEPDESRGSPSRTGQPIRIIHSNRWLRGLMAELVSEDLYQKALASLLAEAHRDWQDVGSTANWFWGDLDRVPPYPELRPFAIRLVHDLINAGAVAGDIIAERGRPWRFAAWPVTPEQAAERITRGLQERETYLDEPGELGWLTFPDP